MRIKTYIKTDKNVFTYQDYALFEFKGKKKSKFKYKLHRNEKNHN